MNNNIIKIDFTYGLAADAIQIREDVFMKEQGFQDEFDAYDNISYHAVLYYNNQPVATARTYLNKGSYIIGRVAVIKSMRKQHLGKQLIMFIEEKIKQLGGTKIQLSAQQRVQNFYELLGYQTLGEPYLDEGCSHIKMIKLLGE